MGSLGSADRRHATRRTGYVALSVFALTALYGAWSNVENTRRFLARHLTQETQIQYLIPRMAVLPELVGNVDTIGYFHHPYAPGFESPDPSERAPYSAAFAIAQYSVAPTLVLHSREPRFLLGVFESEPLREEFLERTELRFVKALHSRILLFENPSAP